MSGAHRKDVGPETPAEHKPLREVESHHEAHDESHRAADAGRVVDPTQPEMYPQRPRAYPHVEPPLALAQRRPAEPSLPAKFSAANLWTEPGMGPDNELSATFSSAR